MKPGIKTSELWLSVGALAAGVLLVALGHGEIGTMLLIAVVPGAYAVSRGMAKHGEARNGNQ